MAVPDGLTSLAWVALCAVLAPGIFGLGLCRALGLGPHHGWRTSLAYGYLVGHLALAGATALWLGAGKPVAGIVLPAFAVITGAVLLRFPRRPAPPPRPPRGSAAIAGLAVLAVVAASLLPEFLRVDFEPIRYSDEAQIWAAKAKVLWASAYFDPQHGLRGFVEHGDYPMWNPLVQVLAFASTDRVLHWENRVPIQCFGIALLLLLSAATSRRTHPLFAALVVFVFAGTSFARETTLAYADVMLGLATLAAVDSLLRLRETGERAWWRLACLATAAMLASKNEGAMLALTVWTPFALQFAWQRWRADDAPPIPWRAGAWLLAPVGVFAAHAAWNRHFALDNNLLAGHGAGGGLFARIVAQAPEHVPAVLAHYGRLLVDPGAHRLLPLLFVTTCTVGAVALRGRFANAPAAPLCATVVATIAGYMLVFVGTDADLQWHMSTAALRTMQQIVPVAALGLCLAAWPRREGT